jgi:hypothetical protein
MTLPAASPNVAAGDAEPMDLSEKATAAAEWSSFTAPSSQPSPSPTPPNLPSVALGLQPLHDNFRLSCDSEPRSPSGSESSESRAGGDESGSDVTSLCSGYAVGSGGDGMSVGMQSPMASNGGSGMQNQVGTVRLRGIPIVSLMIDGKERLCLAQISNTLLKNFSYNEIHNRRVALGITCVQVKLN